MVGQKYFTRGGKREFGEQKYTKYNKINNNSENFRGGQDCCQRGFAKKGAQADKGPITGT